MQAHNPISGQKTILPHSGRFPFRGFFVRFGICGFPFNYKSRAIRVDTNLSQFPVLATRFLTAWNSQWIDTAKISAGRYK